MNNAFSFFTDNILAVAVTVLLALSGLFLNIKLGFFPLLKFPAVIKEIFTKSPGQNISPFKALAIALAGTLGVGNIVGVAAAISIGGPGSVFWMWVAAFLAMIVKYAETVIAMHFRKTPEHSGHSQRSQKASHGATETNIGGAMYFIRNRKIAVVFALLCLASSYTVGNILQTNSVAQSLKYTFDIPPSAVGAVLAVITFILICNGIGRIANFCVTAIPVFSLIYILMSGYIICCNIPLLPTVMKTIISDAFGISAVGGAAGGLAIMKVIKIGFTRGLITNEAGCGTAPIAHCASDCQSPVKQAFMGIAEVFVDTILLCSLTAFVILISGKYNSSLDGMALIIASFSDYFGKYAALLLSLCVFMFALATLVGWSYYGVISLGFITKSKKAQRLYFLSYSLCAFIGAVTVPSLMWLLSDFTCGAMTLINTTAVLSQSNIIVYETKKYFNRLKERSH